MRPPPSNARDRRVARRFGLAAVTLLLPGVLLSACGQDNSPDGPTSTAPGGTEVAQAVTPIFTVPPTDTPIPTPTPTVPPTPEFIDGAPTSPEQIAATNLLQGEAGVYGVAVLGSDGRLIVSHNAHLPFVTASTYKLVVIADILSKVEKGELSLDQTYTLDPALFAAGGGDMYFANSDAGSEATLQDLLFAAGAYSSNVAGLTMLTLTTPESLRQTAEAIGMHETWILSDPATLPIWPPTSAPDATQADADAARAYIEDSAQLGPVNISTPFDMATYMLELSNNSLISPFVSEQILEILKGNLIRDRLPYLQPAGVTVVDKPGNLEDVVNDVGILYLPDGTVRTAALLSLGVPDDDHATQVEQRLALIASSNFALPPYYANAGGTPTP
ncbi:MAG TPA: serine hydrolase [Thermomicrobiales bacterium]|nr:serine hydrolase [Thermomicrobiales bacterium]